MWADISRYASLKKMYSERGRYVINVCINVVGMSYVCRMSN